jgi:hypothetical protein
MASTNPLDPDYDPYGDFGSRKPYAEVPSDYATPPGVGVGDVGQPATPSADTPVVLPAENPVPGAPPKPSMNTLYGIDSESYLTDDQKKLARQIQGKFDASLNTRDRQLAQYGAPKLSSFVEDEALARAMSLARGLNYVEPVDPRTGQPISSARGGSPGGGSGGGGGTYRPPTSPLVPRDPKDPAGTTNSQWSRILSGLSSIVPLLFGKDAYGNLLNKGLIQSVSDYLFGKGANVSPEALERIISSGAGGGGADSPITYNPITGQPMAIDESWTPGGLGDPYGPGSNWGGVETPTDPWGPEPGWDESLWTSQPVDPWLEPGWDTSWWDSFGGDGGSYLDYFGGV